MMTSSNDELMSNMATGGEVAIDINHLRVVRGKRPALHDFSVRWARGSITGLHRAVGLRKDHVDPLHCRPQLIASGTVGGARLPAGSASLRHRIGYLPQDPTIYNDLRIVDNVRYFASPLWLRQPRRRLRG